MSGPASVMSPADRMSARSTTHLLYAIDVTLAICHEIDAASWREWELIHLPGGGQAFVALHLLLVPFLLVGLTAIATGHLWSRGFPLATSMTGLTGFFFHLFMIAVGDWRFREPLSGAVILGFGITSMALLVADAAVTRRHHSRRKVAALYWAGSHLRRHLTSERPVRRPG
jgi:hypothetical protein